MALTAPVSTRTWSEEAVEALVLELLGRLLRKDPSALRAELVEAGSDMPVDSLDLFDVLAEFRQRTGITIPKRQIRRRTMRSLREFSRFVAEEGWHA